MVSRVQQGGIRSANDRVVNEVGVLQLDSGKWVGVFKSLHVARGVDIEIRGIEHRDTKEEAFTDAKAIQAKHV